MTLIHIIAGLLSLIAGAMALWSRKGGAWHRRSGRVFAIAMMAMTSSALLIAVLLRPNRLNAVAAVLTCYLVCTGWLAVRQDMMRGRGLPILLMVMAFAAGAYALALGVQAIGGRIDGIPPQPLFLFGTIGMVAGVLDARLLRAGPIRGAHRLARHLWRMGAALWIATASFFLGQAKFFPAPMRASGLLVVPVLLVLAMIGYWLIRLWRRGVAPPADAPIPAPLPPPGVPS